MLTPEIKQALEGYTANMQKDVTFVLQTGEHAKREELKGFLTEVADVSDHLSVSERDIPDTLRSPVSFMLEADGEDTGIRFSGIPGGHEFNSLVLAFLHVSGTEIKLDDSLKTLIAGIEEELHFEVFVSLSCHNCPDVLQTLNQFAALNPKIRTEMIDGGLFPELVDELNIQGVPTVYLNGEDFANGKIDPAVLVERLMERQPDQVSEPEILLPQQDITVIGGGPAGVAAAIYAARKGLKVTIITDRVGGQVKDTLGIENFTSVPQTTGSELSTNLLVHLQDYDITLREHFRVVKVEDGETKSVHISSGEIIETKALIIATGAKWRELGCPGEKENIGNGVAFCPHCDGPFFKGKDVAVVGGGNSGIEAALDLAGIVKSVTVLEFLPELKADQILVNQAEDRDNISIIKNAATQQILADDGKVTGIEYLDRATDEIQQQDLAGVFVQIGLLPNSDFIKDLIDVSDFGEIVVNERCETNVPGIFACGDVTTVPYKQIVIAMGEGSKASLSAFDYLLKNF
ncbi:MAG: alkyl hydroperoxide reductase subunit F [Rhodospirillaceae bacterium]|nr:alkyl hydroperoxide reductase subunit F [Rhodospirillaceae bacterium]|tara:strand:- start:18673 stop:20226 length:1554 start_codon:yes stop_codon:yes gene_type:complete